MGNQREITFVQGVNAENLDGDATVNALVRVAEKRNGNISQFNPNGSVRATGVKLDGNGTT